MMSKKTQKLPEGWDENRIRKVLDYYETQTDEAAAAEIDSGFDRQTETVLIVPKKLVPQIKRLMAAVH